MYYDYRSKPKKVSVNSKKLQIKRILSKKDHEIFRQRCVIAVLSFPFQCKKISLVLHFAMRLFPRELCKKTSYIQMQNIHVTIKSSLILDLVENIHL